MNDELGMITWNIPNWLSVWACHTINKFTKFKSHDSNHRSHIHIDFGVLLMIELTTLLQLLTDQHLFITEFIAIVVCEVQMYHIKQLYRQTIFRPKSSQSFHGKIKWFSFHSTLKEIDSVTCAVSVCKAFTLHLGPCI